MERFHVLDPIRSLMYDNYIDYTVSYKGLVILQVKSLFVVLVQSELDFMMIQSVLTYATKSIKI